MPSRSTLPEVPARPVTATHPRAAAHDRRAPSSSTLGVPFDASGCTQARHWTARRLAELDVGSSDVREDAELIVSELVSNAVLHGAAPVTVDLRLTAAGLEVAVTDGGGPPYLFDSLPHDATATRGRGLAIVATLTPTWGVRALLPGPGKEVWCRLPTTGTDG